jgi:hypothetical protein
MKPIFALVGGALLSLALAGGAQAAPEPFVFTVPVNINLVGVTVASGPIAAFGVFCDVFSADKQKLAAGGVEVVGQKDKETMTIHAQPLAYWLQNPNAKPATWTCELLFKGPGSSPNAAQPLIGADAAKTLVTTSGKL